MRWRTEVLTTGQVLFHELQPCSAVIWCGLYEALLRRVAALQVSVDFKKHVVGYSQKDNTVSIHFADGSMESGDVLIVADGAASKLRSQMLQEISYSRSDRLQYRGYTAWRGVLPRTHHAYADMFAKLSEKYAKFGNVLCFELGPTPGAHAVVYVLGDSSINWLFYINQHNGVPMCGEHMLTRTPTDLELQSLYAFLAQHWHAEFLALVRATEIIIINDIYDRDPIPIFVSGHVALLGDAAHAITPHAGMGANLAIQDAFELAQQLQVALSRIGMRASDRAASLRRQLVRYSELRRPITTHTQRLSRHYGHLRQGLYGVFTLPEEYAHVSS